MAKIPKFLDFKLSRREFHDTKACRRFKEDLLLFEIKEKTILRRKHMMSFESILSTLKTVLSRLDFSHIRSSIEAKMMYHCSQLATAIRVEQWFVA